MSVHVASSDIPPEILEGVKQVLGKKYEYGPIKLVKMTVGGQQEDRILALTEYKSYILLCTTKTRVEHKFNHLQIDAIESDKPLKLKISLPKEKEKERCFGFLFGSGNDTLDVVEFILKALQRVFPLTSMEKLIRKIQLDPPERQSHMEARLNRISVAELGDRPCGGFSQMYRFMCDYFSLPFLAEVAWDIDTIYLSQDCKELRINDFDDLAPKHMLPIIAALNYNTWFTQLTIVNYKLTPEALKEIPKVVLTSQTLECLTLDGVGLKWEFVQELSTSLLANHQSSLRSINLSNNPIDDRGVKHLSGPVAKMTHGLVELRLAKVGMTAEGASQLGRALTDNNFIPTKLKVLDLSGNAFRDAQHGNLYNFLCQPNNISHLNLADSDCSLNSIFECLFRGCAANIVDLNLSGTFLHSKLPQVAPRQVNNFFRSVKNLKHLNLSKNKLPPAIVKELMETIGYNRDVEEISIDLSCNELGVDGANAISSCISRVTNITSLNLRDNGFHMALIPLVAWIGQNRSIQVLDLSQNLPNRSNGADREKVVLALEELIQNPDVPIHTISLANNRLRLETQQLINALGSNTTLTSVDLSGNAMGDIGARLLAKALQINSKLQVVKLDNNNIGLSGFQDLAVALERNFILKSMPIPTTDLVAAVGRHPEKVEAAMQRIQESLQRNHSPRKRSNKQAFLLQRGFLYTTAHQMVDKSVVHVEDMANELTQKSDPDLQDTIMRARSLIEDANKSKTIFEVLQRVVGDSENDEVAEKLQEIACLIKAEMEGRLERNANGMVDGVSQHCSYVMQDRDLYERIEDPCRVHYQLPERFVEDLVDQISAETSNQCSEANLAMASFISDTILDEIIEQLSSVEAELSNELKKFHDEVASGTTVRQVDSILLDDSRDEEMEEAKEEGGEIEDEEMDKQQPEEETKEEEKKEEEAGEGEKEEKDVGVKLVLNGGIEDDALSDAASQLAGSLSPPISASPPKMTKKQTAHLNRHKSMKRPVSEYKVVDRIFVKEEENRENGQLDQSDLPDLPNLSTTELDGQLGGASAIAMVTPTPTTPTPTPTPVASPRKPQQPTPTSTRNLSAPSPGAFDLDAVSAQASTPLRDLRADRPRVSRAFRPPRPRQPSRPVQDNHNPGNHTAGLLEEGEEKEEGDVVPDNDISAMFASPAPPWQTDSPSQSPSGSQSNLKDSKSSSVKEEKSSSQSKGFFGRFRKKDNKKDKEDKKDSKKEDKKDSKKKDKKEQEKEKKEQEKKSKKKDKGAVTATFYKSESSTSEVDGSSVVETPEPKSPLPEPLSTPEPQREVEKDEAKEEPAVLAPDTPRAELGADTPEKEEELPTPKGRLRPMTGVNMFGGNPMIGANIMQELQAKRNFQSTKDEGAKSPTTPPKPALKPSSPNPSPPPTQKTPSHHKPVGGTPLILPMPSRKTSSGSGGDPSSPVMSHKPPVLSPTSPRPSSDLGSRPVPASRPTPSPRRSAGGNLSPSPRVSESDPLEEEAKAKRSSSSSSSSPKTKARTPSVNSTSSAGEAVKTEAVGVTSEDIVKSPDEAKEAEGVTEEKPKQEVTSPEPSSQDGDAVKPSTEDDVKESKEKEEDEKEDASVNEEDAKGDQEEKPKELEEAPAEAEEETDPVVTVMTPKESEPEEEKQEETKPEDETESEPKVETPAVDVTEEKQDAPAETRTVDTKEDALSEPPTRTGSTTSEKSLSPAPMAAKRTSRVSLNDPAKKTEGAPVPAPKRLSAKAPSPPTAAKTGEPSEGPPKKPTKPKPIISSRPPSLTKKPVLAPKKDEASPVDFRKSLKPVTARKPVIGGDKPSLNSPAKTVSKDSNGETPEIKPKRPSDILKANRSAMNGVTPGDAPSTPDADATSQAEEKEDAAATKTEAVFV